MTALTSADRPTRRSALVRSAGAALIGLPALYLFNPNSTRIPLCPLHALTGYWCPLCGITRASHALLHGQLGVALHDNLLFVLALPLLALAWWRWTGPASQSGRLLPRPALVAVLVLATTFGVLRNLPIGSWLAPPS